MRTKIVKDIEALDKYPFSGHSAIMGKVKNHWQGVDLYPESMHISG